MNQSSQLVVCVVLYTLSVSAIIVLSHYKIAKRIMIFETRSLRLALMAICTGLCSSAWRFWYLAADQHATTWGVGLGAFALIMAPIGWIYYRRKLDEGHGTWLTAKRK